MGLHVHYRNACQSLTEHWCSKYNFENPQVSNFMKIRQLQPRWHPYGQADITKLLVAFRHFANAPKIDRLVHPRFEGHANSGLRLIGTPEHAITNPNVAGGRVQLQGEKRYTGAGW